jgi:hypothetical protein
MAEVHPDHTQSVSSAKLAQVLELACKERTRLKISGGPDRFPYYTYMREIKQTQIFVTKLEPSAAQDDLLVDSEIDIVFPLTSRIFFFGKSVYHGLLTQPLDEAIHIIDKPETLYFRRERRVMRISPAPNLPITCLAVNGEKFLDTVLIKNISLEGICLSFPFPMDYKPGGLIHGLKLKLHGSNYVTLEGSIRHTYIAQDGKFCVGLMWEPMTKSQYGILFNYLRLVMESHGLDPKKEKNLTLTFEFDLGEEKK